MKKGDIGEGIIAQVDFPDKGVLTWEGERVLIKKTIPGQRVKFMISKKRKGFLEGRVLEVLDPSPLEDAPLPCCHREVCGGCTYQSVGYAHQLALKERQMLSLLQGAVNHDFIWEGILPSPLRDHYRNKMEFSFGDETKGGTLSLGMHKKGGHFDIVTVHGCKICGEDFTRILSYTLDFFKARNTPYFHKQRHEGWLRHLLLRRSIKTGEILAGLVTTSSFGPVADPNEVNGPGRLGAEERALLLQWKEGLEALALEGKISGILHILNDSYGDAVIDQGTEILSGQDYIYEELSGLHFKITPFSFFQTNSLGAQVLYAKAGEYIGETKDKNVFDLYSGTGTIAQILAPYAKKVVGVEIVPEAVEAARENAAANGLSNCEFIAGDVLKVVEGLETSPDLIVLDPPREGVHPKALPKIIAFGAEKIIYISCKPTSFAEEVKVLEAGGYVLERAAAVDMFPQTVNVETVCLLSNRKPDTKVRIDVDLEDYYRIKDSKKNQD